MRASLKTDALGPHCCTLAPQQARKAERDAIPVAGQTTGGDGQRRVANAFSLPATSRLPCSAAALFPGIAGCLVVSVGKTPHLAELAFEIGRHAMQQLGHEAAANALTAVCVLDD